MSQLLDQIQKANDIKKILPEQYPLLAQEIRQFLLKHVSTNGGHLASNLGAVELIMALHLCLELPKDKIVFDVGHQSYTHKILTGRKEAFSTLRKEDGLCGFPKRKESECDSFGTGHSSTSISAAVGMALARDYRGSDETIIAVIGDGALSGGMAYEALNNLAVFRKNKKNFIVILNDNKMSISENVGGMSRYLSDLRSKKSYGRFKADVENTLNNIPMVGRGMARTLKKSKDSIKHLFVPGMLFENMGITYYGPVNGHNVSSLMHAIEMAKKHDGPILIHAITKKGKGYRIAEHNPERFHGINPFDLKTGSAMERKTEESWTNVFSDQLIKLAKENEDIVAISAAMPSGTGLNRFKKEYPNRFWDVGIAEEHAVTCAAGMATNGLKPVVAIYSTFFQRAYDQILHDICIQKLPVFLCLDRSGLVGADGETHQGVFDISYLSHIPNMVIMAPKNKYEMQDMMSYAMEYEGPIAMKYPRGKCSTLLSEYKEPIVCGKSEWIEKGEDVVILSVGNMMEECYDAVQKLKEAGYHPGLINVRFVAPLDEKICKEIASSYKMIVTAEENVLRGGFGEKVSAFFHKNQWKNDLINIGIPDCFVEHASVKRQRILCGIDADSIVKKIIERIS